jgi:threonine/homoserine/homoserine lactone efflux protein
MSGFASGLGAASSDLIYAIVAGFSVSMVMEFVKSQEQMLTLLGALVLVGLGLKIFFSNPIKQMRNQRVTPRRSSGLWQDYISTFLLTIANPLAIFLFVAGFSLVGGGDGIIGRVALLCGVFVGAAAWWFILTMLVGLFRKKLTLKRLYYLNKIAGAVIIILAIGALLYKLFFQILF